MLDTRGGRGDRERAQLLAAEAHAEAEMLGMAPALIGAEQALARRSPRR